MHGCCKGMQSATSVLAILTRIGHLLKKPQDFCSRVTSVRIFVGTDDTRHPEAMSALCGRVEGLRLRFHVIDAGAW
jgi:hypothetical protein